MIMRFLEMQLTAIQAGIKIKRTLMSKKNTQTLKLTPYQMEKLFDNNYSRLNYRITYLIDNLAEPQMQEIGKDREFFTWSMVESGAYQVLSKQDECSTILFWCLFMSNENIMTTYNKKFNKGFYDICPMSDIMDLYTYMIYAEFYMEWTVYKGLEASLEAGLFMDIDARNIESLKSFLQETAEMEEEVA